MKRLEILVVDNKGMDFKRDYRYLVTQVDNFDDAFLTFQSFNYDVIAFSSELKNSETVNMIQKLIEVQKRDSKVLFFDQTENLEADFIALYKSQEHESTSEIQIKDDALKNQASCSI